MLYLEFCTGAGTFRAGKCHKSMNRIFSAWRVYLALASVALVTACASPLVTEVTRFNQWPADANGATFTYVEPAAGPWRQAGELEQATYESQAQPELEKLGFRRAAPGQQARLRVELSTFGQTQHRSYLQPVYQEPPMMFIPPRRTASGQILPGFWAPSRFGPAYVGDRVVPYSVQLTQLNLRMLDTQGAPAGQPRVVYESRAVHEGSAGLPSIAPYLVRAALDNFPGQSGQIRRVEFDGKTGAVIRK